MTVLADWVNGARPRTLVASVAPVLVGTAAAGRASLWRTLAALVVGLGLQIGVNFANDYQDGMRGIDTHERQGPQRLTSSGVASPRSVLLAALASNAVAGVAGLALALATTLWLIPIGAAAMLALWLYSGGPRPYAALGLAGHPAGRPASASRPHCPSRCPARCWPPGWRRPGTPWPPRTTKRPPGSVRPSRRPSRR